jgi:hypothetical protein
MKASVTMLSIIILTVLFFSAAGASAGENSGQAAGAVNDAAGNPGWLRYARAAGFGVSVNTSPDLIERSLDGLAAQGVTAVIADSFLGEYLSDEMFDRHVALAGKVSGMAHAKGMKVIWQYPALQVTTVGAKDGVPTMRTEHPFWVSRNFDRRGSSLYRRTSSGRELNLFDEETQAVQYVTSPYVASQRDEVAWLCPSSPYREYFMKRVEKLAASGIDGIELDSAYFASGDGIWPCADPDCRSAFSGDTGTPFPGKTSFTDRSFRQWILWRHRVLASFVKDAAEAARRVNQDFACLVHIPMCDNLGATKDGLDGAWLDASLDLKWDPDPLSGTTGMRDGAVEDWLSLMVTHRFCGGMRPEASPLIVSAAIGNEDGQLIMASILASRCRPHETRVPGLVSSLGREFRSSMFKWIGREQADLFDCASGSEVAVLYSSESRDFVDGTEDGGFYLTPTPPTPAVKWWVKSRLMALDECSYLSEYRGWGFLLIKNHVPFDVRHISAVSADDLAGYRLVVLPNAVCLKESTQSMLLSYLGRGGSIIITGGDAGLCDELGNRRKVSAWKEKLPGLAESVRNRVLFKPSLIGKGFLSLKDTPDVKNVREFMERQGIKSLIDGPVPICVQSCTRGATILIHMMNYRWVGKRPLKVEAQAARLAVPLNGSRVREVWASSPDWGGQDRRLPFTVEGGRALIDVNVPIYQLVKVECEQ